MLRRCAENVERLISIDCSSPTSASTWSNTGNVASSAGGRRPDWCSSAARPSVFSATVLPPVFGPLTTSTRRSPRSRSIGTADSLRRAADAARRAAARSSATSTAAPRQRRESVAQASARSSAPVASTSASSSCRAVADEPRELAQDPLDLLALGARRLGEPVVQLDDRERLDEERLPGAGRVVDDARHLAARGRLHREHRPPAPLGDEALLQELAELARPRDARELLGHALLAVAQLGAEPPKLRRGGVAQVGAVVRDASGRSTSRASRATARPASTRSRRSGASSLAVHEHAPRLERHRDRASRPDAGRQARARRRAPRAPRRRARRPGRRATARPRLRAARSPRRSAPAGARPRRGPATGAALARARRRARSR